MINCQGFEVFVLRVKNCRVFWVRFSEGGFVERSSVTRVENIRIGRGFEFGF